MYAEKKLMFFPFILNMIVCLTPTKNRTGIESCPALEG